GRAAVHAVPSDEVRTAGRGTVRRTAARAGRAAGGRAAALLPLRTRRGRLADHPPRPARRRRGPACLTRFGAPQSSTTGKPPFSSFADAACNPRTAQRPFPVGLRAAAGLLQTKELLPRTRHGSNLHRGSGASRPSCL